MPDITSGADLIDDDLPANLDYLDQTARSTGKTPTSNIDAGESLRSWFAGDADVSFASEVNGETIKILYDDPFEVNKSYWEDLPVLSGGCADESVHARW